MWNILKTKKNRFRGFSLVEIMATVTIIGIVAAIAAPNFWHGQRRDTFRYGNQNFFDLLIQARNSAMTNKKCNNGSISTDWKLEFKTDGTSTDYSHQLKCFYDGGSTDETELKTPLYGKIKLIDFNDGGLLLDGTNGKEFPDQSDLSFESISGLGKVEYNIGAGIVRANEIKVVFEYDGPSYFQTICFNRIAGYPTFSKSTESCNDY